MDVTCLSFAVIVILLTSDLDLSFDSIDDQRSGPAQPSAKVGFLEEEEEMMVRIIAIYDLSHKCDSMGVTW